jgi:AraC-like DNA-binding protein
MPPDGFDPSLPDVAQERRIMIQWDRLLQTGEVDDNAVRPVVGDSWLRCVSSGVDPARTSAAIPLSDDGLMILHDRESELIGASEPILAQARDSLRDSGTIMLLADPSGVILETEGDLSTLNVAERIRLMKGANWNELSTGTNAIGTALSARGPVQIHASEHFCAGIKGWTCSAAVVRDLADGTTLGAIDVSGQKTAFNRHLLPFAMAAADRIAAALAFREMQRRSRLLEYGLARLSKVTCGGMILFDHKGRLVKADARAGLALAAIGIELESQSSLLMKLSNPRFLGDIGTVPPDWLQPDWIEPVVDGGERLGTVVFLPEWLQRRAAFVHGALPGYKLRRVIEFIDAHMDQPISLEDLAASAAVSPFHFHRQFKKATEVTPHQYVIQMRIKRARALLSQSELPLVEIAARVGFSDQSQFTNNFRKFTSMTPKSYRIAAMNGIVTSDTRLGERDLQT